MAERELWKTRLGFLLAAVGSAIGLGNIWRFGYMVYKNGGGAFLIPYFVALFAVGIPIMILEIALGHATRGSAPLAFRRISEKSELIGWFAVLTGFIITTYYVVIIGWAFNYFIKSFTLAWGADPNTHFFKDFLQLSDSPGVLGGIVPSVAMGAILMWLVNWIVVILGVQKGLERANMIFIPALFLLTIILVIRGITLPGSMMGINWYLEPDFSKLLDPQVWLSAMSQMFFTLSLGFGIMIVYGSYLSKETDIINNSILISLLNCGFSFLAGFATFGTLGYMAYTLNLPPEEVVTQSIGLAFVALPKAISLLPVGAKLIGAIFFLALVFAGLSSSVSLVEAVSAALMDKFKIDRRKAVSLVVGISTIISLLYATRGGLYWLDMVDHFATDSLVIVGIMEAIIVVWILGGDKIIEYANKVSEVKLTGNLGRLWKFLAGVFVPIVLIVLIALQIISLAKEPYGGYPWKYLGLGLLVVIFGAYVIGAILGLTKWKERIAKWEEVVR